MNIDSLLTVTEIQRFCMHDGPGVRTTVFLKGCPLRCSWCHNPETQRRSPELLFDPKLCVGCGTCASFCPQKAHGSDGEHEFRRDLCAECFSCSDRCPTGSLQRCGERMTVEEILKTVEKDLAFYGTKGGITLSGGEPFFQTGATIELLRECKKRGLSTVVETCGMTDETTLREAIPLVDLFLWDVKDTDPLRHAHYTGSSNETILENLATADRCGAKTRLRCILVNGVNTERSHYESVADLAASLKNTEGVEWIPYHAYAGTKATFLGKDDNGRPQWIPTPLQMEEARETLKKRNIPTT